jgi:phosphoglycolate phosphatase-like HAD superfamily hydrolase
MAVLVVRLIVLLALTAIFTGCSAPASSSSDPMPSWNDGPAKRSIVTFVERVTKESSPDFVAPAERIATFDNDGTLWAEQPLYFQFLFAFDRVKALAPHHPEWKDKNPFASIINGDVKAALAGGERSVAEVLAASHTGITTDEFQKIVADWFDIARHPTTNQPFTSMAYKPMVELLAYLRANGFKTFIVSGGGVEFMRVFAEKTYGIPPEQVVGTAGKQQFEIRHSQPVIVKLPEIDFVDDGPGKPIGIQKFIGRRPIAAFGNSDGDLQMLQWTCSGPGPRYCLYIHHTDAEREWAYDRTSSIGKLDKGLDEANNEGWTVVDMRKDWKNVFTFEAAATDPSSAEEGRSLRIEN